MSKRKTAMDNLRSKTVGELEAMLGDTRKELANVVMKVRIAQESNVKSARHLRVKIAQIMTIMQELSQKEHMPQT